MAPDVLLSSFDRELQQPRQQHEYPYLWKIRPVIGFEKFLFTNAQDADAKACRRKKKQLTRQALVDPARTIIPRDAMGRRQHFSSAAQSRKVSAPPAGKQAPLDAGDFETTESTKDPATTD
ncbi:unnamed protein product [Didymodactylos carnosus]|uniref:Uncharacterized protein n=1 Tax=Didymodactylos carnosus TaxID=1234261 RepID=A0A815M2W0_9BILA|nr:unnamed protein product [Didymodactylos carnosus]CAF1415960.1 unnamed protein product [Didymodactylos carnosus]CAF3860433.1 unnamed protein product [Didymodactylos carnosus]CAF4301894.1 unnamed protein product [Didymodactylos carnosus]